MTDIAGTTTLITGAAMGMGRAMARRFAAEGARLVLVDRDGDALERTADELRAAGAPASREVHTFVRDLARREAIASLEEEVSRAVGRVGILINNAGVVAGGRYTDVPDARDQLTLDVNVAAVHWMTKAFLPHLEGSRQGHLVLMASAAGLLGVAHQALYSASKFFVVGLGDALRQELRAEGRTHVRVTTVCPSLVDTGMFEGARAPLLAPVMTTGYVVDHIVEAVRRDRPHVRLPFMVKATPAIRALLPGRAVDFLLDRLGVNRLMQHFKGREPAPPAPPAAPDDAPARASSR